MKKSKSQEARELVKEHLGVDVPEGDVRRVVVKDGLGVDYYMGWNVNVFGGIEEVTCVELVPVDVREDVEPGDEYFATRQFKTVESMVKWLLWRQRQEAVGDADLRIDLECKRDSFQRQVSANVYRWIDLDRAHPSLGGRGRFGGPAGYRHVEITLETDEALRIAEGFINGEVPAGVMMDYLLDNSQDRELVLLMDAPAGDNHPRNGASTITQEQDEVA